MNQLTSFKYTKDSREVTIDIVQKAAHKWTNIADRVADDHNVVDNLREEFRGKSEQSLRKVLIDHFIDNKPVGGYSQDWSGLVSLLNDVKLGSLASEIEEAIKFS